MSIKMYQLKWLIKRFGFIKRIFFELKDALIYQKDSRFLLHYWNGHQSPYQSIMFYNLFGRILFSIKEFILKNSIKLEGYNASSKDLDILYKRGNHNLLWPRPPMSKLSGYLLSDKYSKKIQKSLELALSLEDEKFDKTKEWDRIATLIKNYFFDENGDLIKNRVENFRADNRLYNELFNDQFKYIDKSDSYIKSYLQSLDLILEYHRVATKVDKTLLASISESDAGSNLCPQYRAKRISEKLLFHATIVDDLIKSISFDSMDKSVILDIGCGYGSLSRMLRYYTQNSCHILLDLPETLILTSYFIKYNFPSAKIAQLDDIINRLDDFDTVISEYDFIIIPPTILKSIKSKSIDLVINTASLAFMQKEYLEFYLTHIDRVLKDGAYFYSLNKEYDDKWGIGMYNWDFKASYLTRLFEYNNRFSYAQWLGQKVK
jgi:putative sugar O-methyltransferase